VLRSAASVPVVLVAALLAAVGLAFRPALGAVGLAFRVASVAGGDSTCSVRDAWIGLARDGLTGSVVDGLVGRAGRSPPAAGPAFAARLRSGGFLSSIRTRLVRWDPARRVQRHRRRTIRPAVISGAGGVGAYGHREAVRRAGRMAFARPQDAP